MTFSLDEQLAVFDGDVNMVHRSGSKVVLGSPAGRGSGRQDLAAAGDARPRWRPSAATTWSCSSASRPTSKAHQEAAAADQWLRRADLENMVATGNVYLNEELSNGGSNFLTAGRVQYSGQRDTFVIQGTPGAQGSRARRPIWSARRTRSRRRCRQRWMPSGGTAAPAKSAQGNPARASSRNLCKTTFRSGCHSCEVCRRASLESGMESRGRKVAVAIVLFWSGCHATP